MKSEQRSRAQTTICTVLNQKTILVYDTTKDGSAQS